MIGRWDAIHADDQKELSDDLVKATEKAEVGENTNHNILTMNFGKKGDFSLNSLRDYAQANEDGTFTVSEDGETLVRKTKTPNSFRISDHDKVKNRKAKILYLEGDVLVLKIKKEIIYLKRT